MRSLTILTTSFIGLSLLATACGGGEDSSDTPAATAGTGGGKSGSAGSGGSKAGSGGSTGGSGGSTGGSGGSTAGSGGSKAGSGGSTGGSGGSTAGSGGSTAGSGGSTAGSGGSTAGSGGSTAGSGGSTAGSGGSTAGAGGLAGFGGAAGNAGNAGSGGAPPPLCANGTLDTGEADVDCGGNCPTACANGMNCGAGTDCASTFCSTGGKCVATHCDDGVQNNGEPAIDCGSGCPTGCATGQACGSPTDCASGFCDGTTCVATQCENKTKDGAETGEDCGGGTCPTCATGLGCALPGDCTSGFCDGTTCVATSCEDKVKSGSETDVDCGGGACATCIVGQGCLAGTDCATGSCNGTTGKCVSTQCEDGTKNGAETDIDCGGGTCAKCALTQTCNVSSDCASGACTADAGGTKTCTTPERSCLALHKAAPWLGDGTYGIDIDGAGGAAPLDVYCDMTTDGGGWTKILHYKDAAYTPDAAAVGDISTAAINGFAKLSDANVNALGGPGSKRYMMKGNKTTKRFEFISPYAFSDTKKHWGLVGPQGSFVMGCEAAAGAPCNLIESTPTVAAIGLDTLTLGMAANDCDRFFVDYNTAGGSCFNPSNGTQRCVNSGASCNNHEIIGNFTLWARELVVGEGALASWTFDIDGSDGTGNGLTMTPVAGGGQVAEFNGNGHHGGGLDTSNGGYGRATFPRCVTNGGGCSTGGQAGLLIPQSNMTFAFWMKKRVQGGGVGGLQLVEGSGCDRAIGESTATVNGTVQYNAWSEVNYTGTSVLNDGNWHHVVYVLDHSYGFRSYVDGIPDVDAPGGATGNYGVGGSGFNWARNYWLGSVGNCRYGAVGFDGSLDEAAIYGYAMTFADARALYLSQQ